MHIYIIYNIQSI